MVDLDPLDASDSAYLQQMILNHYAYTGSSVAKFVLDDFENQLKNFFKVFPRDYKKALLSKKEDPSEVKERAEVQVPVSVTKKAS